MLFWLERPKTKVLTSYEDMTNIYTDPIYMEQVRPDEERFLDLSKIVFTVGVDYVVVEDGKAVQHEGDSAF